MKKKIIIGSANFNQNYGINNNNISKKEIKKLINLAKKHGINTIDTAAGYKDSEKIIGSLKFKKLKIISKIPKIPFGLEKNKIKTWIYKIVQNSLKNLRIKKLNSILLHDEKVLLSENGELVYEILKELKKENLTSKIGVSIYNFNELSEILKKFEIDLAQAPFNIVNQSLINSGCMSKLKKNGVEIHVRSIFLQGVLLLKSSQLPNKLKKLKSTWNYWESWQKQNKIKALEACLSLIYKYPQIDGIVIGFNDVNQLTEILKFKNKNLKLKMPKLNIKNQNFVDPTKWSKL